MLPDELAFSINCYISGSISLVLTTLLILAIILRTPNEMKNYRIFLLNISCADFLISFSMIMLQPVPASSQKEVERPANDSGISYVIAGPVVYFIHPARNHLLTSLFIGVFLYSVMALPISFFFRYCSVCHPLWVNKFLEKKVLGSIFVLLVLVCLLASFMMYAGDMPKSGPAAIVADWSEYYAHKGDSNVTRFGNLIHMNYMVFYMLYIAGLALAVGYSLLIFSATRLFIVLKKHRSSISKRTHDLQKMLAMTLVFQSSVPIIFIGIPLITIIVTVSSGLYSPMVNSIAMLIFSYQVLFSPLISFIFVRPYRKLFTKAGIKDLILLRMSTSQKSDFMVTKIGHVSRERHSSLRKPLNITH